MITLRLAPGERSPVDWTHYRLAGQAVACNVPLDRRWLPETAPAFTSPAAGDGSSPPAAAGARLLYSGPAWLGGRMRRLVARRDAAGWQLSIDGVGAFWIAAGGTAVIQTAHEPSAGAMLRLEAALGPALLLALAQRGIFALHASAAAVDSCRDGRLILFLGRSGRGKSTLAASLDPTWPRVADDIVPVRLEQAGGRRQLVAWPHFPQLKIDPADQPWRRWPERWPVTAVYHLDRPAATITIDAGPPAAAALALIGHTVAARLFDGPLLVAHAAFAAAAARLTSVRRLRYPRRHDRLPALHERLAADLASRSSAASDL